jgi:hypothetical protein
MNDKGSSTFLVLGVIVIVALICFTVLAAIGASGTDTMRDVLLGLVAGLSGGYAIYRRHNGKEGNGSN